MVEYPQSWQPLLKMMLDGRVRDEDEGVEEEEEKEALAI